MRKLLRTLSLWFYRKTSDWVVPPEMVSLIDSNKIPFNDAMGMLKGQEAHWGMDPEIQKMKNRVCEMPW